MKTFLFIIGKVLTGILVGAIVALLISLARLQMLPILLIVAIGLVLAGAAACVLIMTWSGKGKIKMPAGCVLAVVLAVALVIGTVYVSKTLDTLREISNVQTELVHVGIYVRSDDKNDYNDVATTCRHGILRQLDRESTDLAIGQINKQLGTSLSCKEYDRLPELVNALLNGEVDAIILNQAYLDMLHEMIGFEGIYDRIRETALKQVEVEIEQEQEKEEDAQAVKLAPFVIYISGIDTRGSISNRSRSDVNILAAVNPTTRKIVLISTPRDYYVPLSISNGVPDKLTHAGIYGVNVSMDTLGMLYDVDMNYYFRVNFSGFEKIIDALGGVTVNSDYNFRADEYYYQKGKNKLGGKAALAFCRERYAFSAGDRQRGKHQMEVIRAVIDKAMSPALLQNYTKILDAVKGSFETSMPVELMAALVADQLKNGGTWEIENYSVDGTGDRQLTYSMSQKLYVMQPNMETVEHAKSLIQGVLNKKTATP